MADVTPQEIIGKHDAELAAMKRDRPAEYLDLLKTINAEIEKILAEFNRP